MIKNESPDTRFHLGELETFQNGIVPSELGFAGNGLTSSTNDIGDINLTTCGDGSAVPMVGTTAPLAQHIRC